MANAEMIDIMEDRIRKLSETLDTMEPGTEAYSRVNKDLVELLKERNQAQSNETNMIDLAEKRNELIRMNNVEIECKQISTQNETERHKFEMEFKREQNKATWSDILMKHTVDAFGKIAYLSLTKRAFHHEANGFMQPHSSITKYIEPLNRK